MKASSHGMLGIAALITFILATFAVATAQESEFKQIKLTDSQIQGYIAASKPLTELAEKIEASGDTPDPKLVAQLEDIAKANGFASYDELDLVVANIAYVLSGFDDKGNFTDPHDALKEELEDVKADTSMKNEEKTKAIEEIEQAMASTPKLEHSENIALVKKHLAELDKVMQGGEELDDGDKKN